VRVGTHPVGETASHVLLQTCDIRSSVVVVWWWGEDRYGTL
jgi:hypothetical protein